MLSFLEVFSKLKKHSSLIYHPLAKFLAICGRRSNAREKTLNWSGCWPLGNFPGHSNDQAMARETEVPLLTYYETNRPSIGHCSLLYSRAPN